MALSNQIGAYDDCFEILERALADTSGVRCAFPREADGTLFMFRCHQARALQRAENRRLYSSTDPQWGKSAYDCLVVRKPREAPDGRWWVYIEHHGAVLGAVEDLSVAAPLELGPPRSFKPKPIDVEVIQPRPVLQIEVKRRI